MSTSLPQPDEEVHAVQKLEAIGRLAGGIAHDFNNLLTGIAGTAEDIKNSMPEKDSRRAELDEIAHACARAFDVTRQLLAFARRQVVHPEILDLSRSVVELSKLVRRLVGEDIIVQQNLDDVRPIRIDRGQLEQLMVNLAMNAREAMPTGGRLELRTINEDAHVILEMSDTGRGMTPETLARLFEPFFTTKQHEKGAGLGLATVYGIVNQNGGKISVTSTLGKGTTFRLQFPIVEEALSITRAPAKPHVFPHGDETILVAEDDALVRRIILKKLGQWGYTALEAKDGLEALELFKKQTNEIRLIITDVIMPGMNGRELVEKARALKPEVRVLFTSGYTEDVIAHQGILDPDIDFIEKTNLFSDLATHVRHILDRTRGTDRRKKNRSTDDAICPDKQRPQPNPI